MRVIVDKHVDAPMRDGTRLRANVFRPDDHEPHPVLLTRLPYGKDLSMASLVLDPLRAAERGYIVAVQDVRGRFRSEGRFEPFADEFDDGYDSVEWAARLPGSDGQVAMFGASYFGMTQWQAAVERPPHLRALVPAITWGNFFRGAFRRGGALEWGLWAGWLMAAIAPEALMRMHHDNPMDLVTAGWRLAEDLDTMDDRGYWTLPLKDFPSLRGVVPSFYTQLELRVDDPFWERLNVARLWPSIELPTFFLGGWFDVFLGDTLRAYETFRGRGGPYGPRLLIGPWTHGAFGSLMGDLNFGVSASGSLINLREDVTALHLRWFDAVLKNVPGTWPSEAPVQVFVMGENRWRYLPDWPPPDGRALVLHLHSRGGANTAGGDGLLSEVPAVDETPDRYSYDPKHPVPTRGGALLLAGRFRPGPVDQTSVEARPDVLCYTSEPLRAPLTVIGPVSVTLSCSTSAPDTDFVARLVDVHPDGMAYTLTDGILRLSARAVDWDRPNEGQLQPVIPHHVYTVTIDLWATANTFAAGHRIRLDVTSSSFPRWDRNLNTGESGVNSRTMAVAHQHVFHDRARPSTLHLMTV
ncbi:MAG: CocE/NonD family hydrolase [Clostridia bacterium]